MITLESETSELIGSGMDTLNGKLAGVEEEKLVGRVVELWGFFWDQVLPYVEGVRVLLLYSTLQFLTTRVGAATSPDRFSFILFVSYTQDTSKFFPNEAKWEGLIHSLISALIIFPHRRPDSCVALLPRQNYPPNCPANEYTPQHAQTRRIIVREPYISPPATDVRSSSLMRGNLR